MIAKRWAIGGALVLAVLALGCSKGSPAEPAPAMSPPDSNCNGTCWETEHVQVDGRMLTCVIYLRKAIDCDWPNATRIDTP